MQLGDDFTGEGEEVVTTQEGENIEESETEEDSADTPNGEEEEKESNEDEEGEEENEDDDKKKRELQGLENAEKELDDDLSELDTNISKARERIVAKRQSRRDKRQIIQDVDNKIPAKETDDNLDDVDADAVATIERVIKAKGYVKQQDVDKRTAQEAHKIAQDAFYEKHQEYNVKNDKDDFLYNALCAELALFATPNDPKQIPILLEKAHKAVQSSYPDFFKEGKEKKTVAKTKRIKNAGTGGGVSGSGASSEENEPLSDRKRQIYLDGGWSEEDIDELT